MAKVENKSMADLEAVAKEEKLDMITADGKAKKQGEKVVKKAFGVVIETNY